MRLSKRKTARLIEFAKRNIKQPVIEKQQVKGYITKGKCPTCCKDLVNAGRKETTYCEDCGQRIDWTN